jgi:hypothetical protein
MLPGVVNSGSVTAAEILIGTFNVADMLGRGITTDVIPLARICD